MRLPTLLTNLARWGKLPLALGAASLLQGCFWLDGHQSTFDVEGPVARAQLSLFYVTCWVTLFLFVVVGAVLAYATLKFRAKNAEEEKAVPPDQGHGNPLVELGLIAGSVLALVIIAVPTLKAIWYDYDVPETDKANAYTITATGYQGWFKFEYPKEVAQTVNVTTGKVENAGVLGLANELVIPAGRPVHIDLRTVDVIHSFWIPKLAGKVDMMPNRPNLMWIKAEKPGYYWGQCAEFCGDSHAVMRFRVIALSPRDFNAWLDNQLAVARSAAATASTPSRPKAQFASFKLNQAGITDAFENNPLEAWKKKQEPEAEQADPALIARGRALFQEKTCSGCHTVRGHGYMGVTGPELTHVGARTTIAGGLLENNADELRRWIHNPSLVKPGNKMWVNGYLVNHISLTDADETALVAYLQSLK